MPEGRPRDDRDAAQDLARELADLAAQLASLKGEANAWLSAPEYAALRHRLEGAHASVEAAAVEARRRVRLNEDGNAENTADRSWLRRIWGVKTLR